MAFWKISGNAIVMKRNGSTGGVGRVLTSRVNVFFVTGLVVWYMALIRVMRLCGAASSWPQRYDELSKRSTLLGVSNSLSIFR